MKKHSELLNICLVTNRGCNLRCEHCYIELELLSSKEYISDEVFRLIYERAFELVALDKRTNKVNIESLGGEPTFIPYEFWERNFPFAMDMAEKFRDVTGKKTAFAFCSNMIIKDPRYYDLFIANAGNKNLELFIPWEPDTKRFGSRDKLYKKYEHSLNKLLDSPKTLSLIPTNALIDLGVDHIVKDHIIKHNFNDVSTDMLYQFGSGKEFFKDNMPLFSRVSQWYIDLSEAIPEGVVISPYEEVRQSLTLGLAYHCMGNDHYDVEIEPDGSTSLNSSMTGSEAQMPTRPLSVRDEKWAIKLMFENTIDLDLKLNGRYDFCRQCEYQRYCLGGYYHYKLLEQAEMDRLTENGAGDCPGYKKFWDHVAEKHKDEIAPVYHLNHKNLLDRLRSGRFISKGRDVTYVRESDLACDGYEMYFDRLPDVKGVLIERPKLFSKSLSQRLWFYDSLGVQVKISDDLWFSEENAIVVENIVYDNYICVDVSKDKILSWCRRFPHCDIAQDVLHSVSLMAVFSRLPISNEDGPSIIGNGLFVDARNTELFQWASGVSEGDLDLPKMTSISTSSRNALEAIVDYRQRNLSIIRIYGA